jgi:hypothetical protein
LAGGRLQGARLHQTGPDTAAGCRAPRCAQVQIKQDAGGLLLVLCLTMATSVLSASYVVFVVREQVGGGQGRGPAPGRLQRAWARSRSRCAQQHGLPTARSALCFDAASCRHPASAPCPLPLCPPQDSNSKHVQMVSGASPPAFWAAHLLWDAASFSVPAAGMLALFWQQQLPQFQGQRMAALAAVLWAFGLASLPLTYLLGLLFSDEMRALQRLNTAYFLVGWAAAPLLRCSCAARPPACRPRSTSASEPRTRSRAQPASSLSPQPNPPPDPAATWGSSPAG